MVFGVICLRYNKPQKLEWKNVTKEEALPSKYELKQNALVNFLMNMKTGTKVFQHFLMKTNLSHLVDGKTLKFHLFRYFQN